MMNMLAHANDLGSQSEACGMGGMMNWMMGSSSAWSGWGILGGTIFILFWILILVALILLIVWLFKQIQK